MTDPVFKAGHQSQDNPLDFVLSSEDVDRMGDSIKMSGVELDHFRKNPVALFSHDHSSIVGIWENVRVVGKQLLGTLKLAKPGTSDLVDTVRSLIDQRILKAVSVGFQPIEAEPRKSGEGYNFTRMSLHEVSLCAVPANPFALAVAKSMNPEIAKTLFVQPNSAADDTTGQSTQNQSTPNLDAARTRLKALGIDH